MQFLFIMCHCTYCLVSLSLFSVVTPVISSNNTDQIINSSLGVPVTLSFTITDALPAVMTSQIRWIYSSSFSTTPTANSSNVDITNLITLNSVSQLSFTSDLLSLTISNTTATDDGRYFLVATTMAGSAFSYIDIISEGKTLHYTDFFILFFFTLFFFSKQDHQYLSFVHKIKLF